MIGLSITTAEEVFRNVVTLYITLNESRKQLRPRNTETSASRSLAVNRGGSVTVTQEQYRRMLEKGGKNNPAEPLDFVLDVETKAKHVLSPREYTLLQCFCAASSPELVPFGTQFTLGTAWNEAGLGIEGTYASLYFRVKNEQMREIMKERQEDVGTIETGQFD